MINRKDRPTINFLNSYRAHYGGQQEDVVIHSLEAFGEGKPTLRLILGSKRKDFASFLFCVADGPFYPSLDNMFVIRFGEDDQWQGKFQPVYDNDEKGITYTVKVNCAQHKGYEAEAEEPSTSVTIEIDPPLDFEVASPESWNFPEPTQVERQFATEQWGNVVHGQDSDYEKAKSLAKALCHELWPHAGFPIPEMQYFSPFEMYKTMISGKSDGFCVQFAMIFLHACRCFDITARNIHAERPIQYGKDLNIFLKGMHSISEIFDPDLNRWIFMDLRFNCLGAYLGDEGPLNLAEFHLLISQSHWRERLRYVVYDMDTKTEKRLAEADCPRPFHFYTGWNTVFHVGYE